MRLKIHNANYLEGEIAIAGSKNACLPILACCLLTNEELVIRNVPLISDVFNMLEILKSVGVKIKFNKESKTVVLKKHKFLHQSITKEEVSKIRASYYIIPGLLKNKRKIKIIYPGGCNLGQRPIDFHLQAFNKMQVKSQKMKRLNRDYLVLKRKKIIGSDIIFPKASVGATINTIMLATIAQGTTTIYYQVIEPEVEDVINVLTKMGAKIKVSKQKIIIQGVKKLKGCTHQVIFDRIEAGSYIFLAAAVKSKVVIQNIQERYLHNVLEVMDQLGVKYSFCNQNLQTSITVLGTGQINDLQLETNPYPEFPTDLQQALSALLFKCFNQSQIKDNIYPKRFSQVAEFIKMKGKVELNENVLTIYPSKLRGTTVKTHDLRCGFALVIASVIAKGTTTIDNFELISRGYEDITHKLQTLGIRIEIL